MKKILQKVFYGLFVLGFVWVGLQLFFERPTKAFLTSVFDVKEVSFSDEMLVVLYPEPTVTLEPTVLSPAVRQRTLNVFESLVAVDRDLNFRPSLALSWGRLEDKVWEFKLRRGVKFHDGSDFGADDVVASFERAKGFEGSEMGDLLANVVGVSVVDDFTVRVETKIVDPLLLSKLSRILIVNDEGVFGDEGVVVNGTGPFLVGSMSEGDLLLKRFEGYWGKLPYYAGASLVYEVDKNERVARFLNEGVDLLTFVPIDAVDFLTERGVNLLSMPSLEVQFLLFNFDSEIFADFVKRKAFALAVDRESFALSLGDAVRVSSQYVSNGVFGFNPDLIVDGYDLESALVLAEDSDFSGKTVQVHLPMGLSLLGEHLRLQMREIGVNAVISYLPAEELMKSFADKRADVYFLGFKSESGDAGDFFKDITLSGADFNLGGFSNEILDELVLASVSEFNEKKRLSMLREAMVILQKEVFGVPLLEYENVYAVRDLDFVPRIDGFVYLKDLRP